jgi:hypothetical protein
VTAFLDYSKELGRLLDELVIFDYPVNSKPDLGGVLM